MNKETTPPEAIEALKMLAKAAEAQPEHIMQFFAHGHLPPLLAAVSRPFAELAEQVVMNLPRNPERTVALRKLLEAKDAAVRALIAVRP